MADEIKMNALDKAINYFDPVKAHKRLEARARNNVALSYGYGNHGGSTSRHSLRGMGSSASPQEDIHEPLSKLRERCRDLYMGGPLARSAILTVRTNVVGSGLKLKPTVQADILGLSEQQAQELEIKILREFNLWGGSTNCDVRKIMNFDEIQGLALLSFLMSGDVFAMLPWMEKRSPYQLAIDLVEADCICDPQNKGTSKIFDGVEIGENGEILAYHVAKYHPKGKSNPQNKWNKVEPFSEKTQRRNIIHLLEVERPGQLRGVPFLSPVIELLKQLERYSDAELNAAVISSFFTVFITSNSPEGVAYGDEEPDGSGDIRLGNGTVVDLAPGEKVEAANPGRQNTAFDAFVTAFCRQIGAGLEIPYELLIKHFTASYSASRAALLEAWKMFRRRREWFGAKFCQPIYEEFFIEAVLRGRIEAPGFFGDPLIRWAYLKADWHGPSQGQLNPMVEVMAAAKRVEEGFSTKTKESMELTGTDHESNLRQQKREKKQAEELGLLLDISNKNQGGTIDE